MSDQNAADNNVRLGFMGIGEDKDSKFPESTSLRGRKELVFRDGGQNKSCANCH